MTDESQPDLTAGELRRALAEGRASWTLDDDVPDDARPPQYPLGGSPPPDAIQDEDIDRTDFRARLQETPPGDPDLAQFCIDAGLLDRDAAPWTDRRGEQPPDGERPSNGERPSERGPDAERVRDEQPDAPPLFGDTASGTDVA